MRIGIVGTGEMGRPQCGQRRARSGRRHRCRGKPEHAGGPPHEGYDGPRIYACGPHVAMFAALNSHGLHVVPVEGEIGTASAVKMCYGGMTKGIIGIGAAMFACAERAGVAGELAREFASSQAALDAFLKQHVPGMYPKAYRWVAEMREIASFGSDEPGVAEMYQGLAERYKAVAEARAADIGMA